MKSDWHRFYKAARRWLQKRATTLRLAATYLTLIMIMSISFSFVFYHTSAGELGRQLPPKSNNGDGVSDSQQINSLIDPFDQYHEFFEQRISEGRNRLQQRLLVMNALVLLAGGLLSYWLARETLEPIEAAMEAQSRFASDASHELRTPLAAIQAENEVALRNPKLTLARAKKLLASNLEEAIRLRGLSENLLKLSRDTHDMVLAPVALSDVTSDAINLCLKTAQQKHISIEDQVPAVTVLGDAPSITQALVVLLDNAIKYSDEKTTITITGTTSGKEGLLSVIDQGIGIPSEDLPHIFDRFYRADPSRTKQQVEGHGLGLALAATLIKQLDGKITAESTPGRGSKFTIRLPLSNSAV